MLLKNTPASSTSLNIHRLHDLYILIRSRGTVQKHLRLDFLLCGACFLAWIHDHETLKHQIKEFASEFLPDSEWPDKLITTKTAFIVKRAAMAAAGERVIYKGKSKDPRYSFTTQELLVRLEITDEEEQLLRTITAGSD